MRASVYIVRIEQKHNENKINGLNGIEIKYKYFNINLKYYIICT